MSDPLAPVLILGAGINGAALARELALNRVPVRLVDTADIASGTTAYSSRLIHGGLRYLEYGEFDLVRESLVERTRWLRLAPQRVRPLRLLIPVRNRFGGLLASAIRFLHLPIGRNGKQTPFRGLWPIRLGLRLYDLYARDPSLPRHKVHRVGEAGLPAVDQSKYRWLCEFSDAQLLYPERFTLALVADAHRAAEANGTLFEVFTYHRAERDGPTIRVRPVAGGAPKVEWRPSAIVNATGAWVDHALAALDVPAEPLMGGAKGTHLLTWRKDLRESLGDFALYGEAPDGRPVFVLPFGEATLIGTTDEPFTGDPGEVRASQAEIDYLLAAVNAMLPAARLTAADIALHYCGVRPLPRTTTVRSTGAVPTAPAAVTRRHWLEEHAGCATPTYSIIGGKLTTCRSLAEEAAATLLDRLQLPHVADSRARPLGPDGKHFTNDALAAQYSLTLAQIRAIEALEAGETAGVLAALDLTSDSQNLVGTALPAAYVRWVIEHQWVARLDDLVERRLMLLYDRGLSVATLDALAALLVEAGRLLPAAAPDAVAATRARLHHRFGRQVSP